ncbi:MAG: hypothetical protein JNK48_11975 [Bryobacterales bacterium]|nr:hypothetical protein [Bryobacterales bacterium]
MRRRTFLAAAGVGLGMGAPPAVKVDADGMLVRNGVRTFALGLYQLPQGADGWKRAAETGFHFVHGPLRTETLDAARAAGMHTWATLGSLRTAADEGRIRKLVETWKQRPEILFWETEDEPSFVNGKPREVRVKPEVIRATYKLIRAVDGSRPVYLNHAPTNLVSTLASYNPGGDLIATDVYPVVPHGIRGQYALWPDGMQGDLLNTYVSQVGPYVDKMRQVAGAGRGVWMVLQGFAWEMLREKDRDAKMVRYPTLAETRFMAYQAIVHGATGLVWWGLHRTPGESGLWESIAATARELRGMAAELAAAPRKVGLELEYHDTGHSLDRGVEWMAKPSGNGVMVIAVNADKNPVEVTAKLGGWRRRELFEPFGVRIWRVG